ncbi:MAG TPA: hypothetical protein VGW38_18415 [Chloroflexota bacterium]|nr:hypothetical protein [Chloroflexota bacterium]
MVEKAGGGTSQFVVDLGDVKLPEPVAERIDAAIRRSVLDALAGLDLQGDIPIRFRPEIRGIWVDLSRQRKLTLRR